MDNLLLAIKGSLQTALGLRKRDVFITPHKNFIPTGVQQPCVGIKDGKVTRRELAGGVIEETLNVECVAMVKTRGDGLTGEDGVISLTKKIESRLDQNTLSLDGMEYAWSVSEEPSKMFTTDNKQWLMQKIITFQYTRERTR